MYHLVYTNVYTFNHEFNMLGVSSTLNIVSSVHIPLKYLISFCGRLYNEDNNYVDLTCIMHFDMSKRISKKCIYEWTDIAERW